MLNRGILRREAGARSFGLGEDYFKSGKVRSLAEGNGTIAAKVLGTRPYRVKLRLEKGRILCSCNCPLGQDGTFCKHGVAVGLAWLSQKKPGGIAGKGSVRPVGASLDDVRTWLAAQDKGALVNMLVEQAMNDDRLRRRLLIQAARQSSRGRDLATFRNAIDQAVGSGAEDDQDGYDYAMSIGETLDPIEELLREGQGSEALELAEHALQAMDGIRGSVDDSYGHIVDLVERLQELHLKVCRKAKPRPEELAGRLFTWELHGNWGAFQGAAKTYAALLGKKGLAAFHKLAEAEWTKIPTLEPGRPETGRSGMRFRITRIMETLAGLSGDVEALATIRKRDLTSPGAYLRLAETYKEKGQYDSGLEWAEKGFKAFPKHRDPRLLEFLANEYHRRKRHEEAMALVWTYFSESPSLECYRNLKTHADKAGNWKAWRPKAIEYLHQNFDKAKKKGNDHWSALNLKDRTELVRIFLWEKDAEAAWKEAKAGGCSNDLWMQLAEKREKDSPADAVEVYQRMVEPALGPTHNQAYRNAVRLLKKIHGLMSRLGRHKEFARFLESVRAANRQKRNFIKLVDGGKWG